MKDLQTILFAALLFLTAILSISAQNDEKIKRFEIGGHFTLLNLENYDPAEVFYKREGITIVFRSSPLIETQAEPGFGARFTYNITNNIAIEAEGNYLPRFSDASNPDNRFERGGGKFQFQVGAKIGKRFGSERKKIGVFGKIRPGFVRFANFPTIVSIDESFPIPVVTQNVGEPRNFFSTDIGGVIEYYPTRRTMIRFDVGDTIIRYGKPSEAGIREINPTFARHNLQISAGFGFRF
ncbi:MAG: outer membrane beta-barrel protein [Acidobacteria bacterium]|nr:outer membrane beta-barrel protein [Acidobacteriota bacterium]